MTKLRNIFNKLFYKYYHLSVNILSLGYIHKTTLRLGTKTIKILIHNYKY